ncbi:MAG: phospholipase D-like domain-containing protein [bacterium]
MEEMIEHAKHSIQLHVYIFEEDQTGKSIALKLINASKRGVKVQMLLDGYASRSLSAHFKNDLRSSGIGLRFFEPILKGGNFYFGRRLHHKILVTDAEKALVGGINISDKYNDLPGKPAWLDWAIKVEGDAAYELYKLCDQLYTKKPNDSIEAVKKIITDKFHERFHCPIRIRRNDWVMNKNEISASYMEMFKNAQREIIIMSSYFIPSTFFKHNILKAAKRGVNIKLILAGLSDVGIAKYAERYLYRWAVRHGIEIYEYKHNILHGKVAICDNRIVTIGSYNVNDISALASIELNVDVEEPEFARHVYSTFIKIIQEDCERVKPMTVINSFSTFEKLTQWISYETVRFLFTLFTFYFTRQKRSSSI